MSSITEEPVLNENGTIAYYQYTFHFTNKEA